MGSGMIIKKNKMRFSTGLEIGIGISTYLYVPFLKTYKFLSINLDNRVCFSMLKSIKFVVLRGFLIAMGVVRLYQFYW